MELDSRKREILGIVVEEYIRTGEPVGSKMIASKLRNEVSSATVRNELNSLDKMGFMNQPHTSAGRVPTQAGFLYYLDYLMPKRKLNPKERKRIDDLFFESKEETQNSIESLLKFGAESLSLATNYVSVLTTPVVFVETYSKVDFLRANDTQLVVLFSTTSGAILNELSRTEKPVDDKTFDDVKNKMNKVLSMISIDELQDRDFRILGENYLVFGPVIDTILAMAERAVGGDVIILGEVNLFTHEELSSHLSEIKDMLELKHIKSYITNNLDNSVTVIDRGDDSAEDTPRLSLVKSKYYGGENTRGGIIGIIGPARLNYSKMIPFIDYFAEIMGDFMGHLLDE